MYSKTDLTIVVPSTLINIKNNWISQINYFCSVGIKIIISIPPNSCKIEAYEKGFLRNIRIINSKKKGQVHQRQNAYIYCKTKLIMHLDDDVIIDLDSLTNLLKQLDKLPPNSCIAPRMNKNKNYFKPNNLEKIRNYILFLNTDPQPGSISITSLPVPHLFKKNDCFEVDEVEWLPGGLIILRKSDIINEDYFKFKGKAYCEDLIHSEILRQKGVRLFLSNKYFCYTPLEIYKDLNIFKFFEFIRKDIRSRNYFRRLHKNPLIPFIFVYVFIIVSYFFNKLKIILLNIFE